MDRLNVWKFALAAAVTFAALSAICALSVIISLDATIAVFSTWVPRPGFEVAGPARWQAGYCHAGYLRRDQCWDRQFCWRCDSRGLLQPVESNPRTMISHSRALNRSRTSNAATRNSP